MEGLGLQNSIHSLIIKKKWDGDGGGVGGGGGNKTQSDNPSHRTWTASTQTLRSRKNCIDHQTKHE